jgi:hypothetical protein
VNDAELALETDDTQSSAPAPRSRPLPHARSTLAGAIALDAHSYRIRRGGEARPALSLLTPVRFSYRRGAFRARALRAGSDKR